MTYNVIQYHLQCVALEQAPTKWVCEACEASGGARAKRPRKWRHITILGIVPDYVVSQSTWKGLSKKINPVYFFPMPVPPWWPPPPSLPCMPAMAGAHPLVKTGSTVPHFADGTLFDVGVKKTKDNLPQPAQPETSSLSSKGDSGCTITHHH